uniref:Storkhead box 1 n=1 Tax=Leptobrachium leishanense TaxID=445787 RepID=A0A8C5Q975_9ANUR
MLRMSRDREVQLAPSSMALTLSRLAEEKGSRGDEEEGGRRLFRDFQAANANCFWNKRLVRAVSEVSFQGWLESWVLLVQGAQTSLEVLRDAWVRRALRPPRGFTITALGDVTPVQMSPVSQSQFIPLAEVLCCAISDMNASQILVTQESLLEHLVKHYPGIATPSQEILYNTLGTLIKERKIYHTGEGYFIVTPQTYFITKKPASDNKCQTGDIGSPTPLSITYLVSMESCADLTKGNPLPSVSHCRSCSCFSDHSAHNILGQQSINESNDKSLRAIKESRAPVQNQATSTCRDQYKCGKAKPQLALKEKDKCTKKFGISLFWRNVSKKEKPKKELSTFSAQFPPEEWPVRDEDNLDNIPRDIEHEIIKRINPVLTVDNLMKHTMMMQKAEEQQKYFSKGTSTDIIKNKTGPAIKGFSKKKNRLSKYHRKLQSSKEKNKDLCASKTEELAKKEVANTASNVMASDGTYTVCADVISHNIVYKKQISNPFEGVSYRGNLSTNGHKALKEIKRNNSGKQRRNRARSLDSAEKKADDRTKYLHSERLAGIFSTEESIHKQILPFTKDDLRGYPANYPQCSTLRIDDKFKQIKESGPMVGFHNEERNPSLGNLQNKSFVRTEDVSEHSGTIAQPKGTGGSQVSNGILQQKPPIHCKGATSSNRPCTIVPNSRTEFYKLGNYCGIFKEHSQYAGFTRSPCKEFADDQASFQNLAHGDNACSSLYFDDNTNENISTCQALEKTINGNAVNWKSLHEEDIASETIQWNPYNYRPSGFSSDSSQGYHDPPTLSEDCSDQQKYVHSHSDVASDKDKLVHSPAVVDGSIFDYCNSSEGNSMAETVQTSGNGNCEKHVASGQPSEEPRKCFEHKVKLFNTKGIQLETNQHERNENQSTTGDSGIESPRTRISLASNNSLVLEKLKRRMFLQNLETNGNSKSEGLLSVSSLMQLTPAVNV